MVIPRVPSAQEAVALLGQREVGPEGQEVEGLAWENRHNAECATIRWLFSVEDAPRKMARACPPIHRSPSL